MLRVLEIPLRHHAIAGAGRIAAELQIFLEQLLRRAAHPHIRAAAIEHMVAVQRNIAGLVTHRAAPTAAASTAAAPTGPEVTSTRAFHVHAIVPSYFAVGFSPRLDRIRRSCALRAATRRRTKGRWFEACPSAGANNIKDDCGRFGQGSGPAQHQRAPATSAN